MCSGPLRRRGKEMSSKKFWKTLAFFVIVMFCIIVHAAIWNGVALGALNKAYIFFSLVNLIAEGAGLWLIYSKFIKE